VVINCAAIPEALLEAELFGYARGAFTGAVQPYLGRIQSANGGTLFLDEIGEVPLGMQAKLLRFLDQKEVQRLGSPETMRVDVRVVAATNARLDELSRQGLFREDLFYRLSVFPIELPPLRDRSGDIETLAHHFLQSFEPGCGHNRLSTSVVKALQQHRWDGNVRELQHVMERAAILADGGVILPEHVGLSFKEGTQVPVPTAQAA
jgi:transcriptional regulator with GAF, ATPase, and Fis domain